MHLYLLNTLTEQLILSWLTLILSVIVVCVSVKQEAIEKMDSICLPESGRVNIHSKQLS